ncbi:MAG TPA: O-antigen ligase family protein [Vicinamibacterales bacterium]
MKLAVVLVVAVSILRPSIGLMLIAAIVPLGDVMMPLLHTPPPTRPETLVLSFIAGWLISRALAKPSERGTVVPDVAAAMWIFGALLVASVATTALHLYRANPQHLRMVWAALSESYLWTDDPIGAHAAANLIEGIALVLAVGDIVRREPLYRSRVVLSLVGSAVAVSVASGLLAIGIAPASTISRVAAVGLPRYSAAMMDVNAAGSYYVLLLGVAVGAVAMVRRGRVANLIAFTAIVCGLALTGSRAAVLAAALVTCAAGAVWIVRSASGVTRVVVAVVLAAVLVAAVGLAANRAGQSSLEMRGGFTRASVRMIEGRPIFGVGAGRYYRLSRLVLPPSLAWFYGQENAHDYFLQITAELGIPGVLVFAWLIAAILIQPLGYSSSSEHRWSAAGFAAGAVAYVLTAVSGHPFLVPEAAVPFWIVLGVLASEGAAARSVTFTRRLWPIALGAVILLTVPFRPGEPRLRLPPGEDGFGPWQTDERGMEFREAHDYASLFVEQNVRAIEIPMKLGTGGQAGSAGSLVEVVVPGAFQREVGVGPDWSTLFVDLPGAEPLVPRQRINFSVSSKIDVGQVRIIAAQ